MSQNASLKFISKNREIIYGLVLLIVIPSAILINSFLFINQFQKTIDQGLQLKATAMAEIINVALLDSAENDYTLQQTLKKISKFNNDISSLDILKYDAENNQFVVRASLDETLIGKTNKSTTNFLAWNKVWPVAVLSTRKMANTDKTERVWEVSSPLKDVNGKPWGLLSLSTSLKLMDEFVQPVLVRSVIILIVTILIVVLLLFANARLFQYAMLYNKVKELDQMKDEFVSMASHELRTPITVIQGYATIMLEDKSGQAQMNTMVRDNLLLMKNSADRLKSLIEDMLNVSRIEQGRMSFDIKELNPAEVIKETITELSGSAVEKKLKLTFEDLIKQKILVPLDRDRFKQIMINLIGNAIKYTPSGSVVVSVSIIAKENMVDIKIKDTGIGMSAKDREKLFEKFYRVQSDKTVNITGTGLGLWITKQIVEAMKGHIFVDSIENVGTQISLRFPLTKNKS